MRYVGLLGEEFSSGVPGLKGGTFALQAATAGRCEQKAEAISLNCLHPQN